MQNFPIPANEFSRINALHKLNILDTDPEEKFDLITKLTAQIFDVPISLISLVDNERQWFKSKYGLDAEETNRDVSFCAHAIAKPISDGKGQLIFEVPDALQDARFKENPLVIGEPFIRFYAGFVMQSRDGYNLGALCIIDSKPRKLSSYEKESFFNLGMIAQTELQLFNTKEKEIKKRSYICTRED